MVAPSGGFVSGNSYQVGTALFGVAGFSCNSGATGVLWTVGVYTVAKTSAQAWSVGDIVYFNSSTHVYDNVSSTGNRVGIAVAAAANPSSTGEVRLDGIMNPVVS